MPLKKEKETLQGSLGWFLRLAAASWFRNSGGGKKNCLVSVINIYIYIFLVRFHNELKVHWENEHSYNWEEMTEEIQPWGLSVLVGKLPGC